MHRIEIDVQTGEQKIIELTQEEILEFQALAAEHPQPEPLTPQQKLEAVGLTVEELKELLGL